METENIPKTMTRSAFSRYIEVSPSYVTKLASDSRLVLTDDGKRVRVAESIKLIEETRDHSRDDVAARFAKKRGKQRGAVSFPEARAMKEWANAQMAQIELRKRQGELCEITEVSASGADVGATLRAMMERLPDQLAPILAMENDEARIYALLVDEIERVLTEIAGKIGALGQEQAA